MEEGDRSAEREGFEPPGLAPSRFQGARICPLCHRSGLESIGPTGFEIEMTGPAAHSPPGRQHRNRYGTQICSNFTILPPCTVIRYGNGMYTPSGASSTDGLLARTVRSSSGVIQ